ncbi:MAG TPA: hypothetical protein VH394_27635 [Thermoanaerobaculia bacterium]|jgi:hypothetical protein|nr:hypothetical protein [Thermoanaerobaculia bacterium]
MRPAAVLLLLLVTPVSSQVGAQVDAGRVGAPLDVEEFRYERKILPGPPGQVSVTLDAAVLAHSSLDDLRLADLKGRQIPYLLEPAPKPLLLDLPKPEQLEGAPRSRYHLSMPYPALPASRLLIETPASVFERPVELEGPRSRRGEPRWRAAPGVWRHTDPHKPAPPLALDLPSHPGATVDLLLDEGDNAPLPLGRMRLEIPTWRLRFFHPGGGDVRLLYGRKNLRAPRYDLSLIASQLDPARAREARLGREPSPGAVGDATRVPRGLFWGSLAAAVVVLLLVLARLLQDEGVSRSPGG